MYTAPNVAPNVTAANRSSHSAISVSWTSLNLSEARGFLTAYIVEYTPVSNDQDMLEVTRYINTSASSLSASITDLDEGLPYRIRVSASTKAGVGIFSQEKVVEPLPSVPAAAIGNE